MYQLFEIIAKPKEIDLASQTNLKKLSSLGWFYDGSVLVKENGGLEYAFDLSSFTLKCVMGELLVLEEGEWQPEYFASREELVNEAISQLRKLPFDFEIKEIKRVIKRTRNLT